MFLLHYPLSTFLQWIGVFPCRIGLSPELYSIGHTWIGVVVFMGVMLFIFYLFLGFRA